MKIFNKLYGISLLSLLLSVAACTSETEEQLDKPSPEPSGKAERREVLLTLKNKLSVTATKADPIATADENKISSLDIYVFGSETEGGTYTYQERFCYRENSNDIPSGNDVTALDLTAKDANAKETTALLSLKKGLFVKLYCIANQTQLITADGTPFTLFQPLSQSNPGQKDNTVNPGVPKETDFLTYHSPLIDPALATDILVTPLPMTGSYTTPLDLTDFSVSARLQLGFRLTRTVARFDIVNDAATSKFTIQSVSMAKGRKGVSYFPLKVTGTLPTAADDDLITYPPRKFEGDNANAGIVTGTFYTYPSPVEDGGYLILSGTYATNKSEDIPVSYKVPFKPTDGDNYIEVSQNHRYTVNVTKADEYHLDFTIDVADWTDEGTIDDYNPGEAADENGIAVNVDAGDATYDATTRTVTMPIIDGTEFTIEGGSVAGYYTRMYYENEDTEHQWLTMTPPADATKADAVPFTYTIAKKEGYIGTEYPVAFIRFTDKISAKETVVIVQPFAKPAVFAKLLSNGCTYVDNVLTLYQTVSIPQPAATLNVFASGGSKLDFTGWTSPINWLTVSPATEQAVSSADYILTLNSSDASFPDPYPLEGKTFTFVNKANEEMKETITLKLKSDLTINSSTEGQAEFDNANSVLRLYNNANDKVKLTVKTIGGSEVVDVPAWLTVTKENDEKNQTTYTFYVASGATTGVNTNITIRSKADNSILKTYRVNSISTAVTFSSATKSNSYTSIYNFATATPRIDYFACSGSYIDFAVTSPKGITKTDGWTGIKILSESTLPTGQIQSNVRLQTKYDDNWHKTATNPCTLTVIDKYSNSVKKSITVNQFRVVYEGSKVPPNEISTNGISWWVAPVNENNGNAMFYSSFESKKGSICPSGWKIPSSADYRSLTNNKNGTNFRSYSSMKITKASLLQVFPIVSDIPYYSSDSQTGEYRCGLLSSIVIDGQEGAYVDGLAKTSLYVRCVKDK